MEKEDPPITVHAIAAPEAKNSRVPVPIFTIHSLVGGYFGLLLLFW